MRRTIVILSATLLLALPFIVSAQDTSSALINQALDQPVKLELNTVLPEAMNTIGTQTGVRIEAESAVWDLLPWGQQTNIAAKVENQTLRRSLEAITRKLGLVFVLKDEAVQLQPMPALRRLGRRSTIQELQALDLLTSTPADLKTDRPTVRQLIDAVDQKLVALKAPFAVEYRCGDAALNDATVFVPRNATLSDALESLHKDTLATWYPWGKSLIILSKQDLIRTQLAKTVSIRYNAVDVSQVLMELFQKAGVAYQFEPGAVQRIAPEFRNITFQLDNASIKDALENIVSITGLSYTINPAGVYIANPSNAPRPTREPAVGLITIPDVGMQVIVPQSQVSPDVREYLKHKTEKELEKIRRLMKDEGFTPTTRPTTAADPARDL